MAPGKVGTVFVADERGAVEIHHTVPQCLLRLHDEAHACELDGEGFEAWLNFEHEVLLWDVGPDIGREELEALVQASTVSLGRDDHRTLHGTDFARWERGGGL